MKPGDTAIVRPTCTDRDMLVVVAELAGLEASENRFRSGLKHFQMR